MAIFTSLYHVGEVLAHRIITQLALAADDVIVGPPRDSVLDTKKQMRVTLLWASEQPTHRNDPPLRTAGGELVSPPLSLSATYLLTTYGNTPTEESIGAHELLGDALRVLHDEPELALPLPGLTDRGEGKLGIALAQLTPELVEKLYGPLQIKHRTFALIEVWPVQLASLKAAQAAGPGVTPGGTHLSGPGASARPALRRVVPSTQGAGGRIRLDGDFPAAPTRVWIGDTLIQGGDIDVIDAARAVSVVLPDTGPDAIPAGVHKVRVAVGELPSEPLQIQVVAADEPTLDGPAALAHDRAADLVLSGRGLSGAIEVLAWPERGVRAPSEAVTLPLAGPATATSITVASAALSALADRGYNLAARVGDHRFTPAITLTVKS